MITAFVSGQSLRVPRILVVAGTRDYLEMMVNFQTGDWAGLSKWAHFVSPDGTEIKINLRDDKITKDRHLTLEAGTWTVWIHGTAPSGMRITTDEQPLTVKKTGLRPGDEPLGEIPATPAEQIDQKSQQALNTANQALEEVQKVEPLSTAAQEAAVAAKQSETAAATAQGKAEAAAQTAVSSEAKVTADANRASNAADQADSRADSARNSMAQAQEAATTAQRSAEQAGASAESAGVSAGAASASEAAAAGSAQTATQKADAANTALLGAQSSAKTAQSQADRAKSEADKAAQSALESKGLGIKGAKVGDLARITAVDAAGKPTGWGPTTLEEMQGKWELIETIESEGTLIKRTVEPDGTPYQFRAIAVTTESENSMIGADVEFSVNTENSTYYIALLNQFYVKAKNTLSIVYPQYGFYTGFSIYGETRWVYNGYCGVGHNFQMVWPATNKINRMSTQKEIPAGVVFKIYAVRW